MASKDNNMYSSEDILRLLRRTQAGGKAGGGVDREDQPKAKAKPVEVHPRRKKGKSASPAETGSSPSDSSTSVRDFVPPSAWITAPSPAIHGRFSVLTCHIRQYHYLDILALQNPTGLHLINCAGLPQSVCGFILVSNAPSFRERRDFVDWSKKLVAVLPRAASSLEQLDGEPNERLYTGSVAATFSENFMLLPLAQEIVSAVPAVKRSQHWPQVNPVQIHFPPEDGEGSSLVGPDSAHIITYVSRASAESVRNGNPVGAVRCYARHAMDVALHCDMIHRALSSRLGQEAAKALGVFPSLITHDINLSFPAKAEIVYLLMLGTSVSRAGCLVKLYSTSDEVTLNRHPGEIIMAEFPFLLVWDAASLMGLPYDSRLTSPDFCLPANVFAYSWKVPSLQAYPVGTVIAAFLRLLAEVEGKEASSEEVLPVALSCRRVGLRGESLQLILSAPLPPPLAARMVRDYTSATVTNLQAIQSDGQRQPLLKALYDSRSTEWFSRYTPALPHGKSALPMGTALSYPPGELAAIQEDLRRLSGSLVRLSGQVEDFQLGASEHAQGLAQANSDIAELQALGDPSDGIREVRVELGRFKATTMRDIKGIHESHDRLAELVADFMADFNQRLRALERSSVPSEPLAPPPPVDGGIGPADAEAGAVVLAAVVVYPTLAAASVTTTSDNATAPGGAEASEDGEASVDEEASEDDVALEGDGASDQDQEVDDELGFGGVPTPLSSSAGRTFHNRLAGGRAFAPSMGRPSLNAEFDEDWDGDTDPSLPTKAPHVSRYLAPSFSKTAAPDRLANWTSRRPKAVFLDVTGCAVTSVEILNKGGMVLAAGLSTVASQRGDQFLRITLLLPAEEWGMSLLLPLNWTRREGTPYSQILARSRMVVHRFLGLAPVSSANSPSTFGVLVWEATAIPGWVTLVSGTNSGDLDAKLQVAMVKGSAYSMRSLRPFRMPLLVSMASLAISELDVQLGVLQQSSARVIMQLSRLEISVGEFTLSFEHQTQVTAALLLLAHTREDFDLNDQDLRGIRCKVLLRTRITVREVDYGSYNMIHAFAAGARPNGDSIGTELPPTFVCPTVRDADGTILAQRKKESLPQRKHFMTLLNMAGSHPRFSDWTAFSKFVTNNPSALKTPGPFGDTYLLRHMEEHQWLGFAWKSLGDNSWGLHMGPASSGPTLGDLFLSQDHTNVACVSTKLDTWATAFALPRLPCDAKARILRAFKEALEAALENPHLPLVPHVLDPMGLDYPLLLPN